MSGTVVHHRVERGERWKDNEENFFKNQRFVEIIFILLACLRFCSQCSKSCGKGLQMREVRCLTPEKKHSHECDSSTKPVQEQICNTIPCSPQVSGRCVCQQNCDQVCFDLPANLSVLLSAHRWKLQRRTSTVWVGGASQTLRLHLLQESLLCLLCSECSACQETLTGQWQTAPVRK